MLNMSSWPEIELDVLNEIHLDSKNVRLESASPQVEADIIEDLFVNEDALGLVEGIAQIGYLSHEVPIVVKHRGKYVVVEGNRRVAALKAIQNPMIVPEFQARVSMLTKSIPDKKSLARIRVKVAPNRSQADQLIAALHTSNPRRAWSPARQAAFFQAQIDAGRTYNQLLTRYPTIDVRRFVFRAHMVNLFKNASYDDAALHDFLTSKTWRRGLSALARIFESKDFAEITGLGLDDKGALTRSISDETFNKMAGVIVHGMVDGNINTRSLNTVTSPRFLQLMTELRQIANDANGQSAGPSGNVTPQPPATGKPSIVTKAAKPEGGPGKGTTTTGPSQAGPVKPPPKGKQRWLDIGHLQVPAVYPVAVKVHLGELSTIDIQKFPNGTFLMMRAVLEKSIKSFADAKSEDIRKSGHNTNGFVQLRHALKWLLDYVKTNGPKPLIQPLESVSSGKLVNYTASQDALNAINHNHLFRVEPDEVIHMWNSIDPIMRHLMTP